MVDVPLETETGAGKAKLKARVLRWGLDVVEPFLPSESGAVRVVGK